MKLGLIRVAWALGAVTIAACHFPESKAPDPDDATSQWNVTPTRVAGPSACEVASGVALASELLAALPAKHHHEALGPAVMAEETCRLEAEERQAALVAQGQELEARRIGVEQEQRRDHLDQQLLDQLQALCKRGEQRACDAYTFADTNRGCCTWHHGARMCSEGKVVCFDGSEGEACSC